jgi:hypothetical protein
MVNDMKISIPQPCHQPWEGMTPQDGGRFCGQCSQVLIDFTDKTDEEIIRILKNHRQGSLCVRLGQPERVVRQALGRRAPRWQTLTVAVMSSVLVALGSPAPTKAQTPVEQRETWKKAPEPTSEKPKVGKASQPADPAVEIEIQGKVLADDDMSPLLGVAIFLKNREVYTYTDIEGKFRFVIKAPLKKEDILVVSFVGFVTQEIPLYKMLKRKDRKKKGATNLILAITLKGDARVLGKLWFPPEPTWYQKAMYALTGKKRSPMI